MNVGYPTLKDASIPGDPEGLDAIASHLRAAHDDVSTVQERVAVDGVVASWEGAAADRFRSSLNKLPGELGTVASAFDAASSSIRSFAGQLVDFQSNASYYASRIGSLEEELKSSQRRHDEAQAKVDTARLRESAATDPISLKTAVDAVRDGLGKLQLALDDVEANRGELERIRREAQTNREDYEQAVRACCTTLQDATESTTHSNGAPHIAIATLIAGAVSRLLHDVRDHEPGDKTLATTKPAPPKKTQKPPTKTAKEPPRKTSLGGPDVSVPLYAPLPMLSLVLTPVAEQRLTSMQQQFALRLAADTGLDPIVMAAWIYSEENGSAAVNRQNLDNNDWLNIGYTDSGTYGAADSVWSNPVTAADATAGWLKGQQTVPGYPTAAPSIQAILATAGQPPAAQIGAIQQSGWASSKYPFLPSTYETMAQ